MDYSLFKTLQFFLFFGVVLGFGLWQLISVRREIRSESERKP